MERGIAADVASFREQNFMSRTRAECSVPQLLLLLLAACLTNQPFIVSPLEVCATGPGCAVKHYSEQRTFQADKNTNQPHTFIVVDLRPSVLRLPC